MKALVLTTGSRVFAILQISQAVAISDARAQLLAVFRDNDALLRSAQSVGTTHRLDALVAAAGPGEQLSHSARLDFLSLATAVSAHCRCQRTQAYVLVSIPELLGCFLLPCRTQIASYANESPRKPVIDPRTATTALTCLGHILAAAQVDDATTIHTASGMRRRSLATPFITLTSQDLVWPAMSLVGALALGVVRDGLPGEDAVMAGNFGGDSSSVTVSAGWRLPGVVGTTTLPAGGTFVHGPRFRATAVSSSYDGGFIAPLMFHSGDSAQIPLHPMGISPLLRVQFYYSRHTLDRSRLYFPGVVVRVVEWGINPFRYGTLGQQQVPDVDLASHVVSVEVGIAV